MVRQEWLQAVLAEESVNIVTILLEHHTHVVLVQKPVLQLCEMLVAAAVTAAAAADGGMSCCCRG